LNVKKRDGRIVEFDAQRIINAIEKSMSETVLGIDEKLSKSIATKVKNEIESKSFVR
jgi:ribonucleoside-diphosphate reductase alpha chain